MTTTNTQGAAILCEHEDGRYAVNPDTTSDPAWHRLGPVDISALAASAQSGLTDAYAGAREDLSIWKRRALEAERDLRSEKQTTSRLVGELNAANGPAYMGEPAASPAYGATEYGWADYRRLQDGDKRLIALVVGLYGNDHQSSSDLEGLLDRASHGQAPAQPEGNTGHAEADRLIGRLMSSDPDFEDCRLAAELIQREIKGPDGYNTWREAAIAERQRRVTAAPSPVPATFLRGVIDLCTQKGFSPENIEAWDSNDKWIADIWRQARELLAAPADSVLEDAARYRLVRRGQHWSVIDGIGNDLRAEALDAAIDAALAAKKGETT